MKRSIARAGLAALVPWATLLTQPVPAATLTYDYAQDWLFDQKTGLYWQIQQIPSSTFVPATGTVATRQQLAQLGTDAGIAGFMGALNTESTYSIATANLLSFFQSDGPATGQSTISVSGVDGGYSYSYPTRDTFEFEYFSYAPVGGGEWNLSYDVTLGAYGPDDPCVDGPPCPATELAFVVRPVDLPDSAGLLVVGIAMLGWCLRKRSPVTPRGACAPLT